MAKFKVCIHQYIEMVATHEVEAEDADEALEKANSYLYGNSSALDWKDGDDAMDAEVYAVLDADGETVWEP